MRGCAATWEGEIGLRTEKTSPPPPKPCGGAVPCAAPADACAPGWEVCLSEPAGGVDLGAFRAAMSKELCATNSSGRYVAAMSHAEAGWQQYAKAGQPCPPAPLGSADDAGCLAGADGWGGEPVCCGGGCTVPSCPNSVYADGTRIVVDPQGGGCCGSFSATPVDGVLCCKTATSAQQRLDDRVADARANVASGRKLTAVNVTTYGWYYSF